MASNPNLVPTSIQDKNGKVTTVYKKPQEAPGASSLAGVAPTGVTPAEDSFNYLMNRLNFPDYKPYPNMIGRFLNRKRNKVLLEISSMLQEGLAREFQQRAGEDQGSDSEAVWVTNRRVNMALTQTINKHSETMTGIENLDTPTLEFIADAYRSGTAKHKIENLSIMFGTFNMVDLNRNGEDVNLLAKNVISYAHAPTCNMSTALMFHSLRETHPDFDRPDLYNLPEDKREWSVNVMEVSRFSHNIASVPSNQYHERILFSELLKQNRNFALPYMPEELVLYIRDNPDKVDALEDIMRKRRVTGSDLLGVIKSIDEADVPVLNEGAL